MITFDDSTGDCLIDTDDDVRVIAARSVRVLRCRSLDITRATVVTNVDLTRATVVTNVDLTLATVGGNVDLTGATVGTNVYMDGATVGGSVDLTDATVGTNVYMEDATVGGTYTATGATISGVLIGPPSAAELIMIRRIIEEAKGGALDMSTWHCDTAHCIAGFSQIMSGHPCNPDTALADGRRLLPSASHLFFASDEIALRGLRELVGE